MERSTDTSKREGRWAPLSNLALAARAVKRCIERSPNLPGICVVHARYGSGKTMAMGYCNKTFEGFMVECQSHFTKKAFTQMVLAEMDIKPARTVSDMMGQIAEELDKSGRPLMLDDVHRMTNTAVLGLVLDLHQSARTTIVLAGDEKFPATLRRYDEQLYSRVLVWQPVPPSNLEDARRLAAFYCPGLDVKDDLLASFLEKTRRNARLVCINLDDVREYCRHEGVKKMDLESWGRRAIYTGDAVLREAA